jgi:hypothetical protein
VSPVKYDLGVYIPEGGILYNHRLEDHKSDDVFCVRVNCVGWLRLFPRFRLSYQIAVRK